MAHSAMLFVGCSFGGLNVLIGIASDFAAEVTTREQFCRLTGFVAYRQVGGSVLLLLVAVVARPASLRAVAGFGRREWALLVLQGVFGIYLNQYCFVLGLGRTNPNVAAILQPLCPGVVALLAVLFRMESMTWRKVAGFLVGVAGAAVMLWPAIFGHHNTSHLPQNASGSGASVTLARVAPAESFGPSSLEEAAGYGSDLGEIDYRIVTPGTETAPRGGGGDAAGMLLLVGNVLAAAAYLLLCKLGHAFCEPLTMTALQYCVAAVCIVVTLGPCAADGLLGVSVLYPGAAGLMTWVAVGYAVVIASALNYFLMVWSTRELEASTVGLYSLVQIFATASLTVRAA